MKLILLAIAFFIALTLPAQSSAQNACSAGKCGFGSKCIIHNGIGTCVCDQACNTGFNPVCGSDGISYINRCRLNVAQCVQQRNITIINNGTCNPCSSVTCRFGSNCFLLTGSGNASCVCDEQCSAVQNQVCGTDNATYANPCQLRNASCSQQTNITIAYNGTCDPCANVKCSFGANCVVQNINQTVSTRRIGKCVCNEPCPTNVSKVCGNDDITYDNACLLRNASCTQQKNITIAYNGTCDPCFNVRCHYGARCAVQRGRGRCVCDHACPAVYNPVCGSNGRTYGNLCLLRVTSCVQQTNISRAYNGSCNPCGTVTCRFGSKCVEQNGRGICVCNQSCHAGYQPVCGSDGNTYGNPCLLTVSSCIQQKNITNAYAGKCISCEQVKCAIDEKCIVQDARAKCVCDEGCPKVYTPVCGTDSKTYDNACFLRAARCNQKKNIEIAYEGKCNPCALIRCRFYAICQVENGLGKCVCDERCPVIHLPICASNNRTYKNLCYLKQASCLQQQYLEVRFHRKCSFVKIGVGFLCYSSGCIDN